LNDVTSGAAASDTASSGAGDRVICVVARDVLALDRHDNGLDGLLTTVWGGRWLLLSIVFLFALAATTYAFLATKWYAAETVLTPTSHKNLGGLASQLGSLSSLGSLAGLNLGGDESSTVEALGVLQSRDFARQFIEDQGLLHVLLWTEWDSQAGRWRQNDPSLQPDIRDAVRYFDKNVLNVNEDRKTGIVTLSVRWRDPTVAATWVNMLVVRLNEQMRTRALTEGEANVEYLRKELSSTTQPALQTAIAHLIETELQSTMLARTNREFAFRVIDHGEVPKLRAWPKRSVILAVGVMAGGLVGLVAVFIREFFRRRQSSATAAA
jgi:uncharacterized protein involved in exopolysaccharide biosynthesis